MLSILSPSAEAESNEPKSWALYPILGILKEYAVNGMK